MSQLSLIDTHNFLFRHIKFFENSAYRCEKSWPGHCLSIFLQSNYLYISPALNYLYYLVYRGKVKCSYGVHKFKPSCQKKFHTEKKNNNKTQKNVTLFLATGFEFVYAVAAFYFICHPAMDFLRIHQS